ncbi:DinB family protein [Flavobacterium sp.]|uniref:DinB family protein n=1 Tax=Flavobacterium sp. TaxID=239 RepID=UPI003D0DDD5F
MLIPTLQKLFERDLNRLKQEIESYTKEENLWVISENISNCGGNLCLHLLGNLNTFIGTGLGNTGYVRQRDLEFSQKNIARTTLLDAIDDVKAMIAKTLNTLTEAQLQEIYPIAIRPEGETVFHFLIHIEAHLNYHLGQINYHRRVLDND